MLRELEKYLKAEQKDRTIFDIVIYGSAVKGKMNPEDIDIAVIFREGDLRKRLQKLQEIKKKIKTSKKLDIKAILLEELFHHEFFASSGIFLEGISVFDRKPFSDKIDFSGFSLFSYNLKNKSHTQKVKFNYVLSGRNSIGMLKQLEARSLGAGVVLIPIRNAIEFEEVLKMHLINYNKRNILVQK